MSNKDDLIKDELNWYTEDFEPTKPKSSHSAEKIPSKPPRLKTIKKEKRKKDSEETVMSVKSSPLINVLEHQSQRDKIIRPKRPERKIIKSWDLMDVPVKKVPKIERPEIKLYEAVKITKVREVESNSFIRPLMKNVDTITKSEVPKVPDPLINFSSNKMSLNSEESKILSEKLALLEERDKLIRSSLAKPNNLKQASTVKGTCPDMCPEKERILRSLKKMVSLFECSPNSSEMNPSMALKEYARSSADQEEPLPHELRPEPVLSMAMSYLITRIFSLFEECEDISAWYDFCWNRLRAIRKDIVQQQLCNLETVTIVEQCARFHIVCFDRFWGMDSSIFDEKINTENLMNCLKILLNLYGDLRKLGIECPNEPEFNAYMILIKMNSGDLLWEFLNFPYSLQRTPEVIEAVKIHMFYNSNMYSQFFNALIKTSYLNACLMQRCFTQLRVRALETVVKAYCPPNKEGKVSLQHIMKSLKFDTKEDALAFCRSCNIWYVEKSGFKISHTKFIRPETLLKIKTPSSLVCNKRMDFAQAVVGMYNDMPTFFEHKVHNSFLSNKTLHPDALDASDQEEKMLRDNVERKLLQKTLKSSPVKEGLNVSSLPPSTPILQQSFRRKSQDSSVSSAKLADKTSFEFIFPTDVEDVEMEDISESEDYDMPDALPEEVKTVKVETDHMFLDSQQDDNTAELDKEAELGIYMDSRRVSPLSSISDEPVVFVEQLDQEEELSTQEEDEIDSTDVQPSISYADPHNKTTPSVSPPVLHTLTQKSPPSPPAISPLSPHIIPGTVSSISQSIFNIPLAKANEIQPIASPLIENQPTPFPKKDSKSNVVVKKLKTKLKANLQKMSAKKYGRIWRDKVRDLKKSFGFIPLVSHINMKEYLNVWGHSGSKSSTIINQLNNTKKLCSSVDSLLLFNMFDVSKKNVSNVICETLVNKKIQMKVPFESINQNCPIYWKLVISVPPCKASSYDLFNQIVSWSDQVLLSSEVARKTRIQTMFCKGVKVYCKITVIEGYDNIDKGLNLSALILLNVPGWETISESQSRLDRLVSLSNHPIPVYVISLAPTQSSLTAPSIKSVSFFKDVFATPDTTIDSFLKDLASNSYQMSVKSLHICDIVCEMLDDFVDALQEDCYNSADFYNAMSDPTNILYIYNLLIDKLKTEIIDIYSSNIFGTANEIISAITPNSKYNHVSLTDILGNYFDSLNMSKVQWPPSSSYDLLSSLKGFCERSGIPQVLSQVIRMINPPDEEDFTDKAFSEFLKHLNWLRIMEIIIKAHFRTKFCDVIITYSDKSMKDLINSHWWMECNPILKYCKS